MKRKINAWVSLIIVHLSFQIKTTKASKNDILYGLTVRVKAADIDYQDYTKLVFYTYMYTGVAPIHRCPTFLLIWPPKTPLPVVSNSPLIQNASTVNFSIRYLLPSCTQATHGMSTCHDANSQLVKKSINGGSAVQQQIFSPCLCGILS